LPGGLFLGGSFFGGRITAKEKHAARADSLHDSFEVPFARHLLSAIEIIVQPRRPIGRPGQFQRFRNGEKGLIWRLYLVRRDGNGQLNVYIRRKVNRRDRPENLSVESGF
jgi:hypothetical protein